MTIRVGIVGVGNCANSLLQGLAHYASPGADLLGLVRPVVGSYKVGDIEVVAGFDVAASKVGEDVAVAMWASPNDTYRFSSVPGHPPGDIPPTGVTVSRGPTLDGLGLYLARVVEESSLPVQDAAEVLRAARVEVLVNYLPVGSQRAGEYYAEAALAAGCAVVNCMPVFLASDPSWEARFREAGLPIIGDDVKSQVGATIVHRVLATLFRDRGVRLDRTMQLNIGGNGDFLNMLERERLISKKVSKTEAVVSVAGAPGMTPGDVHIGPSDYVSWLGDRKWAYIRLEGRGFGGAPLNIELKLDVWDSPNSAGIVIDAIRCAALARDAGIAGKVNAPSSAFMKHPPIQRDDSVALEELEAFLRDCHG